MNFKECLKRKVIVSAQAMPDEPFYKEECITAMMQSAINGGAAGLRVAGARDIKIAKQYGVPVIGITKPDKLPSNWKEIVYITPTIKDVNIVIDAGADIVAFDGTLRKRPDGSSIKDAISLIHQAGRLAMADIALEQEGIACAEAGADILSTTLCGYTAESLNQSETPAYRLLETLVKKTNLPVILEGRIWTPEEVKKAFDMGAHSVVIGSAITRPHLITERFVNYGKY